MRDYVTAKQVLKILKKKNPEETKQWIKENAKDGVITIGISPKQRKDLENFLNAAVDAEGKKVIVSEALFTPFQAGLLVGAALAGLVAVAAVAVAVVVIALTDDEEGEGGEEGEGDDGEDGEDGEGGEEGERGKK